MTGPQRQRLLVIGAALSVGLLLADKALVMPGLRLLRKQRAEILNLQKTIALSSHAVDLAAAWQSRLQEYRAGILPADPAAAENLLIKTVRQWAADTGVRLVSMRPDRTAASGQPLVLELQVTGSGDIRAIAEFLYAAETSVLPLRTAALDIIPAGTNPDTLSLNVELQALLWTGNEGSEANES